MDEFISKRVMITLKTGVGLKGIPTTWNDEKVVVTYPDSDNYTTIFNPSENIMMVSVYCDVEESDSDIEIEYASDLVEDRPSCTPLAGYPKYDQVVEPPEPELDHFEQDPALRACKIADLHLQKKEALREQLAHHFKEKTIRPMEGVRYDAPNLTKRRPENNSS